MNEKVIKLSDKAVSRIKEIMSEAKNSTIGVRVLERIKYNLNQDIEDSKGK